MIVAKLDSKIESKVRQVEDLLESLGLKIFCYGQLNIEDVFNKKNYIISDIELAGDHGSQLPRGCESERLEILDEDRVNTKG